MIRNALAAALLASLTVPSFAHEGHALADPAGESVGTERMVFETGVTGEAHEQFLRGLALLHNFEYDRAAAAFRKAQEADPDWVMPYWGEAMTHNHPLWEEQDREKARAILNRLDPVREGRLSKTRSQREAAWLDAVETLYGDGGTKEERDHLYLAKMRALLERDPDDIDARAFTGLAVLGTSHGGRDVSLYMQAAGILEPGFMTHENHPGILHYLIHSYDDPVHAPLGARMAERYAVVAPDAGHAQHMVSHIFHALGDWKASEAANVKADGVVDRQRIATGRAPADCGHYNEWLVYARLQLGKDPGDLVAACRAAALPEDGKEAAYGPMWSYATIAGWHAVDTGNWPEKLGEEASPFPLIRIKMAHIEALRRHEDAALLRRTIASMKEDLKELETNLAKWSPDDRSTMPWAERALAQVAALGVLASGDEEGGLAALRSAAEAESALPVVFGPPMIPKPSWEILGEKLLERGRYPQAAEAFRASLAFAPNRRLSNEGLAKAMANVKVSQAR